MKVLKNSQGSWDWSKFATGFIVILIIPLIALVYNNMDGTIKANKAEAKENHGDIKKELKGKVSEGALLRYLALQQQQTDMLKEDVHEQKILSREEVKAAQAIDKELLKALQNLNINVKLLEQKLKE